MEVIHPRCAGIDVHKKEVVCCIRIADGHEVRREVRSFATTTGQLIRLMDWLHEEGITHVAMESTGPYWRPVWHILEGTVEIILANARHVKNVPGRKSDVKDAEWLADLMAHGLIRGSFVPEEPIRDLRDLTRARKQLVQERGSHVQRIQKVLEYANIKLSSEVTDIMGVTGRRILLAMIRGERDPDRLAALADPRIKASKVALREALRGYVTEHHRFMLKLHLDQIAALDTAIADVEARTAKCLEPFLDIIERLDAIPGVNATAAAVIVAEIGVDMSVFPTADHLIAWAGLCRRLDETAGKPRSTRLRKGASWLKTTLIQCAWSAAKDRDSYLHAKFHRIRRRRGDRKAVVAVAATMLTAAYHVIRDGTEYRDLGPDHLNRFNRDKLANRLIERLRELGLHVEVQPIAA